MYNYLFCMLNTKPGPNKVVVKVEYIITERTQKILVKITYKEAFPEKYLIKNILFCYVTKLHIKKHDNIFTKRSS